MSRLSRRELLERSMCAAAVAAAARYVPDASAAEAGPKAGANDTLRVAVIGVKGRGGNHVDEYLRFNDVRIAAIVDVDEAVTDGVMKAIEKKQGQKPAYFKDGRKMLEDKTIDAVSIATCNHTHSLWAIWAMQAGKNVYVEKPCSHNIFEGRKVVEAARKYNKICQHGTQSRSSKGLKEAMAFLHAGKLGKVKIARGLCYKKRGSIGKKPDGNPPPSVDYDLWLGPAPSRPFNPNRFHYNWHWNWDYGCGDIGNQGVHEMDAARWLLGVGLPKSVVSLGGRFGYEDDGETPNTQIACYDYGDGRQIIFEVRGLDTSGYKDAALDLKNTKIDNIVHAEKGYTVGSGAFEAGGAKIAVDTKASPPGPGGHFRNFIEAVKADNPKLLNAEILEGHLSSALCHLGNISYRLGEPVPFDATKTPFGKNDAGNETFERMCAHLKENEVDLSKTKYRMGPVLAFDPEKETFPGNEAACKLLRRDYRPPFVVPETV
jgi:predicted dehydrogenase